MTIQVNIHEAKTSLSRLIEAVKRGEDVVIARAGKPEIRLVLAETAVPKPKRRFGLLKGQIEYATDFETASLFPDDGT